MLAKKTASDLQQNSSSRDVCVEDPSSENKRPARYSNLMHLPVFEQINIQTPAAIVKGGGVVIQSANGGGAGLKGAFDACADMK